MKFRSRLMIVAAIASVAVLGFVALSAFAIESSSTIYACKQSDGAIHLIASTQSCPSGQTLVTWNTSGPAGPAGPAGRDGAPGEPSRMVYFDRWFNVTAGSQKFFNSGSGTYYAWCASASSAAKRSTVLSVVPPGGTPTNIYAQGVFKRPDGVVPFSSDPRTDLISSTTTDSGAHLLMKAPIEPVDSAGNTDLRSVWTGTVETSLDTTWIHAELDTDDNGSCRVHGTAVTVRRN